MIYIVDDDANIRRAFTTLLKSAGYQAESYDCALSFLKGCQPKPDDLVILDMHMAEMSGSYLLTEYMKKKVKLPVIIVTAYDTPQAREIAKEYGAVAFFRKPFDGEALIDIIKYNYTG